MSNDYYTHAGYPVVRSSGVSATARAEFETLRAAFDLLPALSGMAGMLVVVNGTSTALTTMATGQANVALTRWTPALTFSTPGNLAVSYTTQTGLQYRLGGIVITSFEIVTSSFVWTTSAGTVKITGLPSISIATSNSMSTLMYGGITKAGFTQFSAYQASNAAFLTLYGSGSAVAYGALAAADLPSGGSVVLKGSLVQAG